MYTTPGDAVRGWLRAYWRDEDEIDERLDKIRELRARITGIKAQEITDMPRAPRSVDPMEEYVIRLEAMEGDIDRRIRDHERDRQALLRLLRKIVSTEQREIIRNRYIYHMEWAKVQMRVYKSDSSDEAARRKMYREHDEAMEWMARFWCEKR